VLGWETVTGAQTNSADKTITLSCSGLLRKVISGGYTLSVAGSDKVAIVQNYPSGATSWTVQAIETSNVSTDWTLTAYMVCAIAV
jgi:hypothetical protein